MGDTKSGWNEFSNHIFWTKPIALIVVLFFVIFVFGLLRWLLFDSTAQDLLFEAGLIVLLVAIGLLKAVYPWFNNIVEKGFAYYFYVTFVLLFLIGPFAFFLFVAKWTVTEASLTLQYIIFMLSGFFWLLLLATISYEPWKQGIFHHLKSLGWFLPIVFFVNFIMISVVLFSSMGYFFSCDTHSNCQIKNVTPSDLNYDLFFSWFLWHVTDAVPAIKIPQTLSWDEPMKITQGPTWLGIWLVIFKIAIIVPGIGGFKAYWSIRKQEKIAGE